MKNENYLILLVIIYIVSVYKNYKWYQIAISKSDDPYKDGRWSNADIDFGAIVLTYFPIVNTFTAIFGLFDSPYRFKKENKNYNTFFNVKK